MPMRRTRSLCAAATTGHAAALPSPAMNVRRRIHPSRTGTEYHYRARMAKQFSSGVERVGLARPRSRLQELHQQPHQFPGLLDRQPQPMLGLLVSCH
jgi:hypothetical protein